jgi:hypothetical protein
MREGDRLVGRLVGWFVWLLVWIAAEEHSTAQKGRQGRAGHVIMVWQQQTWVIVMVMDRNTGWLMIGF